MAAPSPAGWRRSPRRCGPPLDLLVLQAPSLAWTEARVRLCRAAPAGKSPNSCAPGRQAAGTLRTLAFFDALHFAPAVAASAIVGLGERDDVVPTITIAALFQRLAGPRELVRLPIAHSSSPLERRCEQFEARWLRLALEGLPSSFGQAP